MTLLTEMEVFYYVATQHSFSKAAVILNMSKGYISQQINDLEKYLGAKLLHRTTRHLSLTEAGRVFLISCEKIVREMNLAKLTVEEVKSEPAGKLKIAAAPSFCSRFLANVLPSFMDEYPRIIVELQSSSKTVNLIEDNIDVAIRITYSPGDDYIAKLLSHLQLDICASKEYIKKFGIPSTPQDLVNHNCLVYASDPNNYFWNFKVKNKSVDIKITGNFIANNESAVYEALIAGVGIAKLPHYVVHNALKKNVSLILEKFYLPPIPIYAVYPSLAFSSPKVTAFINFLKKYMDKSEFFI